MAAYYNEHDSKAAAWLRELIAQRLIADGEVDERSIVDVRPADLAGFEQCHFFAGIGGWSYALRLAGWPDDRRVWTGSCPCQPFSTAGKGDGLADERHLWPAFHWLIEQCRPGVVFGEQVESPAGRAWFDLVSTDLEATGYTCGAVDCPAASVGAPHIRQRLFWVADLQSNRGGRQHDRTILGSQGSRVREAQGKDERGPIVEDRRHVDCNSTDWLANESSGGQRINGRAPRQSGFVDECRPLVGMAHPSGEGLSQFSWRWQQPEGLAAAGATRGSWRDADWLYCRDEKFRPVEPGTFPLGYGLPARVGRLRGYGNAIVPELAQAFIESYLTI